MAPPSLLRRVGILLLCTLGCCAESAGPEAAAPPEPAEPTPSEKRSQVWIDGAPAEHTLVPETLMPRHLPFAGEDEARRDGALPPQQPGSHRDGAVLEFTVGEGQEEVVLELELSSHSR